MAQTLRRTPCSAARPGIARTLAWMITLQQQRRALARLDDHLLDDIGVARDAARNEAERAPWDAPDHWQH